MPSENSMIDRFTLFGVTVHIEYEDGREQYLSRLMFWHWDAPALADDTKSVYIVIRSYAVNDNIPEDTFAAAGTSIAACKNGIRIAGDGASGRGFCSYPAGGGAQSEFSEIIDTLALFLVAQAGRIPLHASAAVHDNVAVVFAGRSGAGKSSMAFAANQAGMAVLSDDTVYVQYAPHLLVWGIPSAIHLLADEDVNYANSPLRYRGGRWKRALPVGRTVHLADRAILCVLARGDQIALEPIHVDEAVDMLTCDPEPGYGFYGSRSADAIRAIAARGCWRLTLSHDPSAAITALLNAWPRIVRELPR